MSFSEEENINWFSDVVWAEPDQIYGVQEAYLRDTRNDKINLSIGVYRDERGQPFVPPSVKKAEELVIKANPHKEYAPIEGLSDFRQSVAKFIFGDQSDIIKEERHATVQGLGGTGSIRIGAIFLKKFLKKSQRVYLPEQTWSAHNQVFMDSGFEVKHYRYFDKNNMGLDFQSMVEDISQMPSLSIILFHSIAHNPTGTDPTLEEWKQLIDLIKMRKLFVFVDCAYQGFASGSVEEDSKSIQLFGQQMNQWMIATTFAKNMGLYGERIGALSVVCGTCDEANNTLTQLKRIIRPIYSHPPNNGAHIVTKLLNDWQLRNEWLNDVKQMQKRITEMRSLLIEELNKLEDNPNVWHFIDRQRGMYCYLCFNESQVIALRQNYGIYVADEGRVNIAAINLNNVKQIATAFHCVKHNY